MAPVRLFMFGDQQVMNRDNGAAVFTNVKDDIGYIGRYPVGATLRIGTIKAT